MKKVLTWKWMQTFPLWKVRRNTVQRGIYSSYNIRLLVVHLLKTGDYCWMFAHFRFQQLSVLNRRIYCMSRHFTSRERNFATMRCEPTANYSKGTLFAVIWQLLKRSFPLTLLPRPTAHVQSLHRCANRLVGCCVSNVKLCRVYWAQRHLQPTKNGWDTALASKVPTSQLNAVPDNAPTDGTNHLLAIFLTHKHRRIPPSSKRGRSIESFLATVPLHHPCNLFYFCFFWVRCLSRLRERERIGWGKTWNGGEKEGKKYSIMSTSILSTCYLLTRVDGRVEKGKGKGKTTRKTTLILTQTHSSPHAAHPHSYTKWTPLIRKEKEKEKQQEKHTHLSIKTDLAKRLHVDKVTVSFAVVTQIYHFRKHCSCNRQGSVKPTGEQQARTPGLHFCKTKGACLGFLADHRLFCNVLIIALLFLILDPGIYFLLRRIAWGDNMKWEPIGWKVEKRTKKNTYTQ